MHALLLELLLGGFFAVACIRARANRNNETYRWSDMFRLTDRIERLRQSRWQWCSMVFLLLVLRRELGAPLLQELTVLIQLVIFLSLPVGKPAAEASVRA